MDTAISYRSSGWVSGMESVNSPDKAMTEKEWKAYLKKIDAVEESIRKEIEAEGSRILRRRMLPVKDGVKIGRSSGKRWRYMQRLV